MTTGTPVVAKYDPENGVWLLMEGNRKILGETGTQQGALEQGEVINDRRGGPGVVVLNKTVVAVDFVSLDPSFWFTNSWTDEIRAPVIVRMKGSLWEVTVGEFRRVGMFDTKNEAMDAAGVEMSTEDRPCTVVYRANGDRGDLSPNVDFWDDRYGGGTIG